MAFTNSIDSAHDSSFTNPHELDYVSINFTVDFGWMRLFEIFAIKDDVF